ncbi:hypothetical protein [Streptomyces sp. NPDC088726]|uniref:hypothetical protein n=1 Tax=Streptomyces sp. NPDC088726 TaxID=3365874 RepID=UPI0038004E0E
MTGLGGIDDGRRSDAPAGDRAGCAPSGDVRLGRHRRAVVQAVAAAPGEDADILITPGVERFGYGRRLERTAYG